jgi:hypothetical protein
MIGFLLTIPFMSIVEYVVHRWMMHRETIFSGVYVEHALEHHGKYYRRFNHEPDPAGRELNLVISYWYLLIPAIPALMMARWSLQPAGMALGVALYLLAWNTLHSEMHDPRGRFFSRWRVYRYLRRYHYLHHRHVTRNFNATLPLGLDRLMGTSAVADARDLNEMAKLGY